MTRPTDALAARLLPADSVQRAWRAVLLVLAGTALIAVSARINVPMWPVPMTMQTWAVLLVGLVYGGRLGGATLAAYLAQGAVGLPVFAGGAGVAYMMGPTGGYLVGFVAAAALVGLAADRGWHRSVLGLAAAITAGTVIIFACGVAWLAQLIGPVAAVQAGLLPFLAGAVVKGALVAATMPLARRLIDRLG